MITSAQLVYAEGGQSSSPGIAGQKPLGFVSISLEGGGEVSNAVNVPTQPKFNIVFDKNVVNSTIWDNNRQCFGLISADNKNIPVVVSKIDDTVDFNHRQNIYVQPVNPLSPGTSYTLTISPDLQAKNGKSTLAGTTGGQGITISFKTAGQAPVQAVSNSKEDTQQPPQVSQEVQNAIETKVQDTNTVAPDGSEQVQKAPQAQTVKQEVTATTANVGTNTNLSNDAKEIADKPEQEAGFNNWYTILAAGLIVGWISVEYCVNKRDK
nr:Ig-like domain-containing protein [Sporomusa ovata]